MYVVFVLCIVHSVVVFFFFLMIFSISSRFVANLQKTIKVGGQFRTVGSTVCAATMSNIEIGAKLGIVLALGPLTARGTPLDFI